MCYVLSQRAGSSINSDNAFLCGLLHEVGKLYILTRAKDYPNFLGDDTSLDTVMAQWSASVGESIVQAWGFPDDIAETMDAQSAAENQVNANPSMFDIVAGSQLLVADAEGSIEAASPHVSLSRLGITSESYEEIAEAYQLYVSSMLQSISG